MKNTLSRSINKPIRQGLSTSELWSGPDRGLIWCWERGRQIQTEDPDLAERARAGELVPLVWKRGTLKSPSERHQSSDESGSLLYLATWQGLRGEDLDLSLDEELEVVCAKTGKKAIFKERRSS